MTTLVTAAASAQPSATGHQVISSLSGIGLEKPVYASVGGHVWLRRGESGFLADPAREALD